LRSLIKELVAFAHWRALYVVILMLMVAGLEGAGLLLLAPLIEMLGIGGKVPAGRTNSISILIRLGVTPSLTTALLVYLGLIVVHSAVSWRRDLASSELQHGFVDHLRRRLFESIGAAKWEFLAQANSAEFSHALTTDIGRVYGSTQAALQIVTIGVVTLTYAITAVHLSPLLALTSLAMSGLLLLTLQKHRRQAERLGSDLTRTTQRVHGEIAEFLAGLKLAKSSNTEARLSQSFAERLRQSSLSVHHFAQKQASARGVLRIGAAIVLCAFVYFATAVAVLPAASVLALIFIFIRLFPQLSELQHLYERLLHTLPAYAAYVAMRKACMEAAEPAAGDIAYTLADGIRLEQVTFRPLNSELDIIAPLNLTIPAHRTTALVGHSGAGKSTLADLLTGMLAPTSGRILIDDCELHDRRAWRECVAYVPQDVFLFNSSLRDNVLWTTRTASDAEIWEVLGQASAADFVKALPQGLDTVLGERGLRLSGGERQRLAIARALLGAPLLLVLDEATSALDRENERRIQSTLAALHGHLTVVVIAHSAATLQGADRIVSLAQGRIVESHDPARLSPLPAARHLCVDQPGT
jgi:ATP-binding cassette subfamily C protein